MSLLDVVRRVVGSAAEVSKGLDSAASAGSELFREGYSLTKPLQSATSGIKPAEIRIAEAREMFDSRFGLSFDADGHLTKPVSEHQLDRLGQWNFSSSPSGIMLPTRKMFFEKSLLARGLMPQEDADHQIRYLFGKGHAIDLSVQGNVIGRERKIPASTYRPHSDFELYAFNSPPGHGQFVKVFGGQENFPPTVTKGLSGLPQSLLADTSEKVNLGGVQFRVPGLEYQFVDKLQGRNADVEQKYLGAIDSEILARTYPLNRDLVHKIIDSHVVDSTLSSLPTIEHETPTVIDYLPRLRRMALREHEFGNIVRTKNGQPTIQWGPSMSGFQDDVFVRSLHTYLKDPATLLRDDGSLIPNLVERVPQLLSAKRIDIRNNLLQLHNHADAILESSAITPKV